MDKRLPNLLVTDPAEELAQAVDHAWHTLCKAYDVTASVPEVDALFEGLDLSDSESAAHDIVTAMLTDITELVSRFSSWYTKPARAFGLISNIGPAGSRSRWVLAPEAAQRWQELLQLLEDVIRTNSGFIQATLLVGRLMDTPTCDDPYVLAGCRCQPGHKIRLRLSVMKQAELVCNDCKQPLVCEE